MSLQLKFAVALGTKKQMHKNPFVKKIRPPKINAA